MKRAALFLIPASVLFLAPVPAFAEISLLFYVGMQLTHDGDLRLKKGGSDLTFRNVRWEERPFTAPIYYGVRASYWLGRTGEWGVAIDFTHAKTILREKEIVAVSGTRDGSTVDDRERIADSLQHFELSHGLNMVTFNGLHRWFPDGRRDESAAGRLQCYTGLGAGFSVPHVEAQVGDERTGRYQFGAGPVMNAMLGVNYDFSRNSSGVLEYKLSHSDATADLSGGGYVNTRTLSNQFISGVAGSGNK